MLCFYWLEVSSHLSFCLMAKSYLLLCCISLLLWRCDLWKGEWLVRIKHTFLFFCSSQHGSQSWLQVVILTVVEALGAAVKMLLGMPEFESWIGVLVTVPFLLLSNEATRRQWLVQTVESLHWHERFSLVSWVLVWCGSVSALVSIWGMNQRIRVLCSCVYFSLKLKQIKLGCIHLGSV